MPWSSSNLRAWEVHSLFPSPVLYRSAFVQSSQAKETYLPPSLHNPASDGKTVVELASTLLSMRQEGSITEPVENQ